MTSSSDGVAHLDVGRASTLDPPVVGALLADPGWLGRIVGSPPDRPDMRRVETDLAFSLRSDARTLTFRKAALVDVGAVDVRDGACTVEIGWRAASFAPLFPVFAGQLVADGRRLDLHGVYAPPGGGVGLLIDQAFLHHVARRTARWFLDRVAEAVVASNSGADPAS
jgi:hypothetical protein